MQLPTLEELQQLQLNEDAPWNVYRALCLPQQEIGMDSTTSAVLAITYWFAVMHQLTTDANTAKLEIETAMRSPELNVDAALAVARTHADAGREEETRTLLIESMKTWMNSMYGGIAISSSNTERLNKANELMQSDMHERGTEEVLKVTAGLAAAMSDAENNMEKYWSKAKDLMAKESIAKESIVLNAATRTLLQVVAESATVPNPEAEPLNISELLTELISKGECNASELGTAEQIRAGEVAEKPLNAVLQALDQTAASVKLTPNMLQKVLLKRKGDGPDMLMTPVVGKSGANTKIYVFARRWTNATARSTSAKTKDDMSNHSLSRNDLDRCGGQSIADHFTLNDSEIQYDLQILEMKDDTLQLRTWTEKEDAATLGGSWKKATKKMNRHNNRLLVSSATADIKIMAAVMPKGKLNNTLMLWRNREEAERWLGNDKEVKLSDNNRTTMIRTSSTKWEEIAIPEGSPGPDDKKRPAPAEDDKSEGGAKKKLDLAPSPAKMKSVHEAVMEEAEIANDDEPTKEGADAMSASEDESESDSGSDCEESEDEEEEDATKKATNQSRGQKKVKGAGAGEFLANQLKKPPPAKKGAGAKHKKKK